MSTASGGRSSQHRATENLDVVIVGAGLSGVGTAVHLQREHPRRRYAILEAREDLGGTWSLFRYPGIRSDSDMHTLGFRFRPWSSATALADGPSILSYVRDTAREFGVDEHIRYSHRLTRASWDSATQRWTLEIEGREPITASFLLMCSGYYRYDRGYTPEIAGIERFDGPVVHPQHWDTDLDHAGKRIVVVGSGATAATLVPALLEGERPAEHVTMLQRSPSYVLSLPRVDPIAAALSRWLPRRIADPIVRTKNITQLIAMYQLSQRFPNAVRRALRRMTRAALPEGYAVDTHFNPRYDPWDQRMCMVPDGDLFRVLRRGRAEMVTDTIETVTETGVRLGSGRQLDADVLVTATGLNLQLFGGAQLVVDGAPVHFPEHMAYKGMMLSGIPNLVFMIGYTNASWTLKVDLVAEYVTRLLGHMDRGGFGAAVAERDPDVDEAPFLDFSPGYVQRSIDELPKQGSRAPWRLAMNYALDAVALRRGRVDDPAIRFVPAAVPAGVAS